MNSLEVRAALNKFDVAENVTFFLKTLILSYADHHNYRIKLIPFSDLANLSSVDMMVLDSGNYASLNPNPYILTSVVPFYSLTLAIPTFEKHDKSDYFAMPFDKVIWMVYAIFPLYFAAVLEISLRQSRIILNILEAIRVLASGTIRLPKSKSTLIRMIYLVTIAYGFVMSIIYLSYLGCFLTGTLDKDDFQFVCNAARIEQLKSNQKLKDVHFLVRSTDDYLAMMHDMDMNYGYCMTSSFWHNTIGFQGFMEPMFRRTIPWQFAYGHFLRINKHSKHVTNFNQFLLNAYSSGFMKKWGSDMLLLSSVGKVRQYIVYDNRILSFRDLISPFKFYACGLFMSIVVFAGEVCLRAIRRNVMKRRMWAN